MTVTAETQREKKVDRASTRDRIKAEARRLFIAHGTDAVTYGDIAERVGTTRANLHYHFGSKSALINEVFEETFRIVSLKLDEIWKRPGLTLDERIRLTMEDARERHREFNPTGKEHHPWSLSSRARFKNDQLGNEVLEGIWKMSREFEDNVAHAVQQAIDAGELRTDTSTRDIVLLITPVWYFGSPISQFAGWRKLEEHYGSVRRTIQKAYGSG
ncbi:TetR/AcrR family transcriptional regulator [Aquisalimonas sp. APHAB1-3]|uniref:TetR/AcrR family transcriptional regulator n=1 Tax=Aquisalimonas sp. APHAB1-3 TaxID=3402080 RepID=UPI003AAEBFF2